MEMGDTMSNQSCFRKIIGGAAAVMLLLGFAADGQAACLEEQGQQGSWQTKNSVLAATPAQETQAADSPVLLSVSYDLKAEEPEKRAPLAVQLNQVLALELQLETEQNVEDWANTHAIYEELLIQLVTGGYNREQGTENKYAREHGSVLDQQMADYYRDFINANGNSRTAAVLEKYLQVLEENGLEISGPVLEFYEETPELVRKWSHMEKGDARYWLWKLGLLDLFES